MARISDKSVSNEILRKINEQLTSYIASIHTKGNGEQFVKELFNEEERLMVAKRLAIVIMLEHDCSYITIQKTLRVSPQTVSRVARDKDKGRFTFIEKQCSTRRTHKRREQDFWFLLEKILLAGLPPQGKGRWQFLDELYGKKQK